MDRVELLHLCSSIMQAEHTLNIAVDKLLQALGVTKEEAKNGNFHKKIDTG